MMQQVTYHIELQEVQRIIFTCKRCKNLGRKHVWAHDYTHKFSNESNSLYRFENGKEVWDVEDYDCPNCHSTVWTRTTRVSGELNEQHACNAKCMGATNGVCSCSCGGKNHGISHLI